MMSVLKNSATLQRSALMQSIDKMHLIRIHHHGEVWVSQTWVSRIPPPATIRTKRWKPFINRLRYHLRCTIQIQTFSDIVSLSHLLLRMRSSTLHKASRMQLWWRNGSSNVAFLVTFMNTKLHGPKRDIDAERNILWLGLASLDELENPTQPLGYQPQMPFSLSCSFASVPPIHQASHMHDSRLQPWSWQALF